MAQWHTRVVWQITTHLQKFGVVVPLVGDGSHGERVEVVERDLKKREGTFGSQLERCVKQLRAVTHDI